MNTDGLKDAAEPTPASAGSVASIDAHRLMRELRHISLDEWWDPSVRKVASQAKSAIGLLAEWVSELQMNAAERDAIRFALGRLSGTLRGNEECGHYDALAGLLERHE